MAVIREVWTDNLTLIAAQTLAKGTGGQVRTVLDLTGNSPYIDAAELFLRIGRLGATALASTAGTAGVKVLVRELFNGASLIHPANVGKNDRISGIAAAVVGLINNVAGYAAGTSTFVVDSTSMAPAAGSNNWLCMTGTATDQSATASGTTISTAEFVRQSFGSATSLNIDSPCKKAHVDNERITTQADVFAPIKLEGGRQYEVIFDYADNTSGTTVLVEALYKTMVLTSV